jgi:cytochrome c
LFTWNLRDAYRGGLIWINPALTDFDTLGTTRKGRKPVKTFVAMLAVVLSGAALIADAADDAAAEALARKSKCLTCHSVDKKKDGPSYKDVAAKYKGDPAAEQKLYTHLTTHPKVKVDGKEEMHESLKTTNDAEIKNVIGWILTR